MRFCPVLLYGIAFALPGIVRAGESEDLFEKKIRPVLVEHCYKCHSAEAKRKGKLKGGLLLDTRAGMRAGGDGGPAVAPGQPGKGTLLAALRYDGDTKMPPAGKLPGTVVKDFERWIETGAFDPRVPVAPRAGPSAADLVAARKHWAFQRPQVHPAPPVQHTSWPTQPIDAFVLAKLEAANISPSPPAGPRALARRLSFDLTGLPPTPEVVEAFAADPSPAAYRKLVEQMLGSPAYGEKWARLWLDVARYAEDQAHIVGDDQSLFYPNAYLYRDWVIGAFNKDLPFDRFVTLQLAADLVSWPGSKDLPALGFLGLGPKYYGRGSLTVMADEWEDRVDVVGRGLQGLTFACARCHDHKYDPIRTEDYYGLAGVFAGTKMFNRPLTDKTEKNGDGQSKSPKNAMHIVREGKPTDLTVFIRGDVNNKGAVTPRHFPAVLCSGDTKPWKTGSGRKDLAAVIASPNNPLTARVIVNRIWAAYFGTGIVGTPSNFGALGERPTHPELLDDLAVRFMQNGWSLKWLHRQIVLSSTYRQSAGTNPNDPDHRLLSAMPRRRLGAEGWRDAVLAAAGTLDTTKVGGPSIDPMDVKSHRRTVYSRVSRLELNKFLAMFDFPDANVSAEKRAETITPLQKLFLMNGPFVAAQAKALSDRLAKEVPDETSEGVKKRIDRAYRVLYSRPATEAEMNLGIEFLGGGPDQGARWKQYAQVLLMANEMMYVD
ncbi:MAG TPA: PSD1 and planctomycete cytochrome C domain-containing protein [Fimbriiglobus sp.]|jgi:hypothetical protein